ncbi:MAG: hypothetical protein JWP76_5010 [Dactylosporangium sp.]|jgi:hypothetical protein|nr:hypothetical protein [Dactylosporangium sp.]
MTTIEVETNAQTSTVADHLIVVAVCLFALLGLVGIITMTV